MTAKELLEETHPGRTILEDVVKPLGMNTNALAKALRQNRPFFTAVRLAKRSRSSFSKVRPVQASWHDAKSNSHEAE